MSRDPAAVILLSGGLDSATVAYHARSEGFDLYALSFCYGQRHRFELEAARTVAKRVGVLRHEIVEIDLSVFGGSALTSDLRVPKNRSVSDMESGVPITYVPARNTIFLSFGLAWAEVLCVNDIFIGVNAIDYSGYPDCRPEYIEAFQRLADLATKAGVEGHQKMRIHAPLIRMTKGQIIQRGLELGVDYALTHTCYDPDETGQACGSCDACQLRLGGFAESGVRDPITYKRKDAAAI